MMGRGHDHDATVVGVSIEEFMEKDEITQVIYHFLRLQPSIFPLCQCRNIRVASWMQRLTRC